MKKKQMERQDVFCWSVSSQENLFDKLEIWAQKTALVFILEGERLRFVGLSIMLSSTQMHLKGLTPALGPFISSVYFTLFPC